MNDFTARDLFAGLAMVALMSTPKQVSKDGRKVTDAEHFADLAYDMAEAMLKEKEKRDGGQEKDEG